MFVAYRGFSVILFAPVCALLAVLLTDPALVPPMFSGVFMDKMVGFIKSYLPVFLLGAVFGKVIELSGFARSIVTGGDRLVGRERAMLSIVLVCALLTYGGVSLFVVVFAVYPFAAEMFRQGGIPEAADPGDHRARRVHLHDGRAARHAADPEHHSHHLLQDQHLGGAVAGRDRRGLHPGDRPRVPGMAAPAAAAAGEGYGTKLVNEPEPFPEEKLPNPWLAISPLVIVGVMNKVFTVLIPRFYGATLFGRAARPGEAGRHPGVRGGDLGGGRRAPARHPHRGGASPSGRSRNASPRAARPRSPARCSPRSTPRRNTASARVIAALPGFLVIADGLKAIPACWSTRRSP